MPTTDSPSTMMTSAPCRSVTCEGWMENRPRGWTISGEITGRASATAHST
jgi:hypothetical protein